VNRGLLLALLWLALAAAWEEEPALAVATCNRKPANLQSRVFFNRHYLQLTVPKTDIKCN
jgi:hypothetical protein